MAEAPRIDLAALLNEASALAGANPFGFVIAACANVGFGTWADMQPWSWNAGLAIYAAAAALAGLLQYFVLRRALGVQGNPGRNAAIRLPLTAVTLHLLGWLVVGAAYLLLVVPGLYLAGRLSPAVAIVAAERRGLVRSVVESWRRTRRAWWPLLLAQALLLFPLLGFLGLVALGTYLEWGILSSDQSSIAGALLGNLATGAMAMAGWAIAGAAYRLTVPDPGGLEEVFA